MKKVLYNIVDTILIKKATILMLLSSTLMCIILSTLSCNKDSNPVSPPATDVTGTWNGTYSTSIVPTSTVMLNLTQSKAQVNGTYSSSNGDFGTVSGTIRGNSIDNFSLTQTTPNCPGSFSGSATVAGDTMDFTFNGADCWGTHSNGTGKVVRDKIPPTIISTSPANNDTGVSVYPTITATFSEEMDSSTIINSTFTLKDSSNNPVNGTVSYSNMVATFTPLTNLTKGSIYTATITTGVKDLAGNTLATNYIWRFRIISYTSTNGYVINPIVTLNDYSNYQVESAYIGKSYSTSTFVYGIIKIKYLGSTSIDYISIDASFKNSSNSELFTDWSYIRNITTCYTGHFNTNSFFTPIYNTGYYFIIEDLSEHGTTLTNISKVDLILISSPFIYAPPLGTLSKVGNPYRVESDSWYLNVTNNGDRKIETLLSPFIFKDLQNRMFMWSFPSSYVEGVYNRVYDIGQSGYFKSLHHTPDYISVPLDFVEVCLEWDFYTGSGSSFLGNMNKNISIDERNKLMHKEIDKIEREKMLKLYKK